MLLLSITSARSVYAFTSVGVHVTVYGAVVSVAPICSPSAKNVTLAIVPSESVAVAATVTLLLADTVSLADGVVRVAVGAVPAAATIVIGVAGESKVDRSLAVARATIV